MSSKKISTRERILQAAWKLLESEEGSAVRMSDIAKAAAVSRQAVYLHFSNRADLLKATTRFIDEKNRVDERLVESRQATSGAARLDAWIAVWGDYIPVIYGVARALLAMQSHDAEARAAWDDRMQAVREGCHAAVVALEADGVLSDGLTCDEATDFLWAMLSVETWERLTVTCGWSQEAYLNHMRQAAHRVLLRSGIQ